MKAWIVPPTDGAWVVKDVPAPEPGRSKGLLKIRASGLGHTDGRRTAASCPGPFTRDQRRE